MIKTDFQKELQIAATQQRGGANNKKDVKKIQSWLTLFGFSNPDIGTVVNIDGDFGPATETAVKRYQKNKGLSQTGIVDMPLFQKLSEPLQKAFTTPSGVQSLRDRIIKIANNHLDQKPFEVIIDNQNNSGPWVRSYMNGLEGTPMLWCMGFVQTIIDQAASEMGKDFRKIMPVSISCDEVANHGKAKGHFIPRATWRANPKLAKPGDIFLLFDPNPDKLWFHTGIISKVLANDTIETIEGNTNINGSNNGIGVYKRVRNFQASLIDLFSIKALV
jgi:peptidoglycan hydrolase-like protein with peptidoglycan-binding domain